MSDVIGRQIGRLDAFDLVEVMQKAYSHTQGGFSGRVTGAFLDVFGTEAEECQVCRPSGHRE